MNVHLIFIFIFQIILPKLYESFLASFAKYSIYECLNKQFICRKYERSSQCIVLSYYKTLEAHHGPNISHYNFELLWRLKTSNRILPNVSKHIWIVHTHRLRFVVEMCNWHWWPAIFSYLFYLYTFTKWLRSSSWRKAREENETSHIFSLYFNDTNDGRW